jgi:hypothetical protein
MVTSRSRNRARQRRRRQHLNHMQRQRSIKRRLYRLLVDDVQVQRQRLGLAPLSDAVVEMFKRRLLDHGGEQ